MLSSLFVRKLMLHFAGRTREKHSQGFTILEVLVVVVIIGVLAAVAVPGWLTFSRNQRLNAAQIEVFNAIKEAQSQAKRIQTRYQVSFSENPSTGAVRIAVHRQNPEGALINWNTLIWERELSRDIRMKGVSTDYPATGNPPPVISDAGNVPPYLVRGWRFDEKAQFRSVLNTIVVLRTEPRTAERRCILIGSVLGGIEVISTDISVPAPQNRNCED
jgi:prepilin-type N-terminal cleavage/methylation domain-containing protein